MHDIARRKRLIGLRRNILNNERVFICRVTDTPDAVNYKLNKAAGEAPYIGGGEGGCMKYGHKGGYIYQGQTCGS